MLLGSRSLAALLQRQLLWLSVVKPVDLNIFFIKFLKTKGAVFTAPFLFITAVLPLKPQPRHHLYIK
jgi:hypothetical protein